MREASLCLADKPMSDAPRAQVVTSINNLIIGRIYVDHGGVMRIRNTQSGLTLKLRFREHSFLRSHNEHEARPQFSGGQAQHSSKQWCAA